jgi:hypothetical protein
VDSRGAVEEEGCRDVVAAIVHHHHVRRGVAHLEREPRDLHPRGACHDAPVVRRRARVALLVQLLLEQLRQRRIAEEHRGPTEDDDAQLIAFRHLGNRAPVPEAVHVPIELARPEHGVGQRNAVDGNAEEDLPLGHDVAAHHLRRDQRHEQKAHDEQAVRDDPGEAVDGAGQLGLVHRTAQRRERVGTSTGATSTGLTGVSASPAAIPGPPNTRGTSLHRSVSGHPYARQPLAA